MADFPGSIFSQRELLNIPGMTYDVDKKTTVYAEDLTKLGDETTAIENYLQNSSPVYEDLPLKYIFYGTDVDLGTNGQSKIVWSKERNMVYYQIYIYADSDCSIDASPVGSPFTENMPLGIDLATNLVTPGGKLFLADDAQTFNDVGEIATVDVGSDNWVILCLFPTFGLGTAGILQDDVPRDLDQQWYLAGAGNYMTDEGA